MELKAEHKLSVIKNATHFCIASQILVNDLKKLGISYRKSLNENLPIVPKQYIKDFIRGIIDGDGSISIDQKGYPAVSLCGGEKTVIFVRNYFFTQFRLYSRTGKRSSSPVGTLYEIKYHCTSAKKILDYLYSGTGVIS